MNPSTQPPAAQPPIPDNTPFKTDVVQNIPMQTQMQTPAEVTKDKDDVALDMMMQDVGQELKKNVNRPAKHHFFSKQSKALEIPQPKPGLQLAPTAPQPTAPMPDYQTPPQAQNQAQPATNAPAKPKTKHSVPIFIILVTIIITGALVVVAVAAYKQK